MDIFDMYAQAEETYPDYFDEDLDLLEMDKEEEDEPYDYFDDVDESNYDPYMGCDCFDY